MGEIKAQLDVLESCASAVSNEAAAVGAAADALADAHTAGSAAGSTPASAGLVAALAGAAAHWHGELAEAARLLTALGAAIDHDAVALRTLDARNAAQFRPAAL